MDQIDPRRRRPRPARVATRWATRTLGAVAPGPAVDVAARLMAHVGPRAPVRPKDRTVHERARQGVIRLGAERVVTYQWGDDQAPAVLLAHGWQLRASRMSALVTELESAGLRVLAFDAVAHGSSSGRRANVFLFAEALRSLADDVVAAGGEVAGVVGHSLGGLAAGIAVRDGLPATRWVAISSPAGLTSTAEVFASTIGLPQRLVPGLVGAAAQRFLVGGAETWQRGELVQHPAHPDVPALFVRDVDDVLGLPGDARRLHAAHPRSDLLVTGGLGHNRVLDDPEVCAAVVAHLTAVRVPR
ncbi:conserved hypothetical protein [Xylanimonas cellulosilytica DSM 15894]|uniref:Serine aminopeptidase S33 domain-containing protein n=1 Tax=Xylanimonas cellulosilytica (strain DSM 15894 / JCM 12276 / CECT 5975 / KCTC 9989 / LMG 20990 / NBRC 107835 / XIL07) TaxID=446471 RepID=D1BT85_XYLCX|nr:alpha/beta hydrolase [Xylanimonas cellulosilytica]ACZ30927.1 conserved hypothetical protein [Xylanimonas cellulosilytica DSM 15894]